MQPRTKPLEHGELVSDTLVHVPHSQFAAACAHHWRAPPGDDGDLDAGAAQLHDAVPVVHVEDLQGFPARPVIQPPIGEDAVHVEHQQTNGAGHVLGRALRQTTPARSRSWTLRAPTRRPCSSATGSAVMRCTSIRCTASAASSFGPIVLPCTVMTLRMGVRCTSICRSSVRRRSLFLNTPRMCSTYTLSLDVALPWLD